MTDKLCDHAPTRLTKWTPRLSVGFGVLIVVSAIYSLIGVGSLSFAAEVDASDCPCLDNGGQPTQRCPCDVARCYDDCVDVLCPSFPQCTFECSRRCYCGTGAPLCPTHEDPGPTPTAAPTCAGDCDDDGRTTVDEVLQGVGVVLGMVTMDNCRNLDRNGDGQITIEEIVKALNAALYGCVRSAR